MADFLGLDVIRIFAPQDRSEFQLHVLTECKQIGIIRFANDDGSPIEIDFSDLDVRMYANDDITFGEFEELNSMENGFEVVGDFGIIWVKCKKYSYFLNNT